MPRAGNKVADFLAGTASKRAKQAFYKSSSSPNAQSNDFLGLYDELSPDIFVDATALSPQIATSVLLQSSALEQLLHLGDGHSWEPKAMNGDLDLLVGNPAAKPYYWALPLPPQEKIPGDNILGSCHGYDYRAIKRLVGSLLCYSKWDQAGVADVPLDPSSVSLWGISMGGSLAWAAIADDGVHMRILPSSHPHEG